MSFSAAHSAHEPRHSRIHSKRNFFISFNDLIGFLPAIRLGAHTVLSISEMTCCRRDAGRRARGQGFGVMSRTRIPPKRFHPISRFF
ncbi:hypothetical protein LGM46_04515 [Burkholderia arboris]|uniref:hypothetical protein n=1 Tax=Burkholderia arboris TaxID=488730 RepID=UPI001CF508A2|nr:hypothetical protein [Burkholderia arboris]MCA8032231.1 hypothetical protein [Burkholderia arboris]